uniref:Uncharacterized protein n=1 Tax=Takifugu rubripes TaxID=31033 RepID=A0A674MJ86_TAKRU
TKRDLVGTQLLYLNEFGGLHIIGPDVIQRGVELNEECRNITGQQIQVLNELAKDVEREKKKAIGINSC